MMRDSPERYRAVKLHRDAKLYKKDGTIYENVANGVDTLIGILKERNHELVSEYKNSHTKVVINFQCGHEPQEILPTDYKRGHDCPKCGIERRLQHINTSKKVAENELIEIINKNGHLLLNKYKNAKTKVLIDLKCGHRPHLITPNSYKKGSSCPKCGGNSKDDAQDRLEKLINENGHLLLSKYIDSKTKVVIDFQCGHKPHSITPNHYKCGKGCPKCARERQRKSNK